MVSVLRVFCLFLCLYSFQNIFALDISYGAYEKILNSKRLVLKRLLNQNSPYLYFFINKNINWVYNFLHEDLSSRWFNLKKSLTNYIGNWYSEYNKFHLRTFLTLFWYWRGSPCITIIFLSNHNDPSLHWV